MTDLSARRIGFALMCVSALGVIFGVGCLVVGFG